MSIKNQPSSVSATQWGKTVTIAVEHSDVDLYELLEMFKGLAVGLEYSESSWRKVIKELGAVYEEEDIDEALAEHNQHEEELEEWDTTNTDGLPKVDPTNL
jgi:transposase